MNVSDSELMLGKLTASGYTSVDGPDGADVILLNTCAIREHAEQRVIGRLGELKRHMKSGAVLGVTGCVGVFRRLPFAYGAYVVVALGAALSYPVTPQPLASLPRYELVLFPLFMWGTTWVRRRRIAPQTIAVSAVLLGLFTAEFSTWHFVA